MIPIIAAGLIALGLLRSTRAQAAAAKPVSPGDSLGGGGGGSDPILSGSDFLPGVFVGSVGSGSGPVSGSRQEISPPPPPSFEVRGEPGTSLGAGSGSGLGPVYDFPVVDLCGRVFAPEFCLPIWGGGMTWFERYGEDDCGTCKKLGKYNRLKKRRQ